MKNKLTSIFAITFLFTSCAIVRPGEVGVKQHYGKLKGKPKSQGIVLLNPFTSKLVKNCS